MNNIKKSKASALIYAIVIMAVVGAISLGVAQISIKKTQITAQTVDGIQAYYLAESGTELGYTARNLIGVNTVPPGSTQNNSIVLRATLPSDDDFANNTITFTLLPDSKTQKIIPNKKTINLRTYQPKNNNSGKNYILATNGYYGQSAVELSAVVLKPYSPGDILYLPYFLSPNELDSFRQ